MLNYQRVVRVPLGSFRILWACHTSLKKWCQDASFGHVRWWHGFDHHSDSRWCSSGAGPRSRSHSGFWPWEWLWVTTCTKQVSKICFVCICVYACPGYWCSYYVSTTFCQPQSNPTSLSAWKTLKEVRFLSPEGQFSWGTRVWEHRINPSLIKQARISNVPRAWKNAVACHVTHLLSSGCVWKCCVPLFTQWFCWSLSLLNGYNWEYTLFSDKPKWMWI